MRLASLARKIKVTPSKLSEYLTDQNIDLTQGSNTKLTDAQVAQVLLHFGKELPSDPIEEKPEEVVETTEPALPEEGIIEEVQAEAIEVEEETEPIVEEEVEEVDLEEPSEITSSQEEPIEEEVEDNEPPVQIVDPSYLSNRDHNEDELGLSEQAALDENVKVIKPPKVILPGLKVKGKIDLPEPKPKAEKVIEVKTEEAPLDPNKIIYTSGPKKEDRRKPRKKTSRRQNPNYNPVEAERKRKEQQERRAEENRLKALKKAKSEHYKKKVVVKATDKSPKFESVQDIVKKPKTRLLPTKQNKPATKNPLKRFWKWMNT